MNNFVGHKNIGLMYMRGHIEPKGAAAGVTNLVSSERTFSRPGMSSADSVAPLYIYHDDGTRTPNFTRREYSTLTRQLSGNASPEDILDYIYAVLHSPNYREKYKEFLKIDFPRVPAPTQVEFDRLARLGRQLRELHLMNSPSVSDYVTTFPAAGDNIVEKVRYVDGDVWINDAQYFGNVPEMAWNFYIGGYQPAQKWLKDHKGRKLTSKDLDHYQKIIKILTETDRIMKEIDE
jgi:predicted helicase